MSDATTPTAAPAAATPPPAPVASPPPATPPPGEEYRAMSPEAFKERLASERDAARRAQLKDLGFERSEDLKGALAKLKAREDADLSESQRIQKQLDDLAPRAKRAEALEARIKGVLEAEEGAIPDAKRALLELAPSDPADRLEWIARAKARGLFADAQPAAPEPKREPKPATTMATGGPATPPPAGTQDPYQTWQKLRETDRIHAATFYAANAPSIERARPARG